MSAIEVWVTRISLKMEVKCITPLMETLQLEQWKVLSYQQTGELV